MTCVATAWDGMEQQRDEWSSKGMESKAQTSNGMARKSLEKQWLWMQGVALISSGKAWSRSESQWQ